MGEVVIEMSMSLDGFICVPDGSDAGPPGAGVERLHEWMFGDGGEPGQGLTGADQEIFDELRGATGAMIAGRRLYDITHGCVIGGASIDQQILDAGLADELRIDVVPVVLGDGIRLFDQLRNTPIELEQVKVMSSRNVTHLRYKVSR